MIKYSEPTLIINESIARANIKRMAAKAKHNSVAFEPHFKTHQSAQVGEWYKEEGVEVITVSSVAMAQYFADKGWNNIIIAFPVNILEFNKINTLSKSTSLTLLVQDNFVIEFLASIEPTLDLLIELDAGYHRSGVAVEDVSEIEKLVETIQNSPHRFKGFYYHAGNSYKARGKEAIKAVYTDMIGKLSILKEHFSHLKPHIAIGDTPICSVMEEFDAMVDSIHPGNFVYYDATQIEIGSCKVEQVATHLRCPVVAVYEQRNQWVIYGGGVHLSKESIKTADGIIFGLVGKLDEDGSFNTLDNVFVTSLSQEHGIISSNAPLPTEIKIGDVLAILPVHSCMAVDCMQKTFTESGKPLCKLDK